jgi:hypothetical protein
MYIFLLVLTITVSGGLHVWQTLFDNFAVTVVHLEGHHVGMIQSVREIPGFLALVESKTVAGCLYILDHIFFNFAIAISTFFQKIADPRDIAPSMAMGFTINHIAAVVLPAIGGLLWIVDYRIPFIAGAGLSFISLLLVQCITGQLAAAEKRAGSESRAAAGPGPVTTRR